MRNTSSTYNNIRVWRKSLLSIFAGITSVLLVAAGLAFFGNAAQAVVTVSGSFTGYSVADIKAYAYNSATVTSTMTTATSFSLDGSTNIELARNGVGSPFQKYTVNGPSSVDCISTPCVDGDPKLSGFTFSILDSSNNPIPTNSAQFTMYDALIRVSFSGSSSATVPAGSTIKFEFAPSKVLGNPSQTDQIRTVDVNSTALIDQTSVYNWFKKIVFNGNPASASSLGFSGTEFVLASDSSATSTLPSYLYRAGYTLASWNTAANGSGTSYALGASFNYPVQSTTLYAQWNEAPKVVNFNTNGGTGSIPQQSSLTATTLTSNSNNITRSGYTFTGWNTVQGGTGTAYANGATFPFSASSTTLYAQWTPNSVTFNSNGGSGTMAAQSATTSTNLTANAFTRAGYTFAGWSTSANGSGTQYANSASYTFASSTTLYAKWAGTTNTVTYDSHGGTAVVAGSFTTGGTIANLATAPTRTGYSFVGWFEAASGGTVLANGYAPSATSAITLHAQWNALAQTVTFDANGGTGTMTAQTSGSAAVLTTNTIARTGYGFTGWNTAVNGSGTAYAVDATHPFTSSETLYAQWRALPATPVAAVDIQVPVGTAIANAPVDLDVDGLKDQTGYTVTVFSTPQIIDQGTIWSGRLNTTVRIPSNLEAGWHRLVIEGTAADGTPWTEENFFKVSPGGILLATSEVVPAELAMTGSNSTPILFGAGALIIFGSVFLLANTTLRRRVKRND